MLQKLMLVDDGVIWRYMDLLSSRPTAEIEALRAEVAGGRNILGVKELFAREIVTRFHSAEGAEAAIARRRNVAEGGLPDDIEELRITADGPALWIAKALALAGLAKSSSEGLRLVKGGAVHLDGEVVKDDQAKLERGKRYLVRVGSKNRRFARLVIE
jgi:tyrosyl-tRNA synthetase